MEEVKILKVEHIREVPFWFTGIAVNTMNDDRYWFLNGKRHREDGPAVIRGYGAAKEWWLNGLLHRIDGPAIERPERTSEWWWNGKHFLVDSQEILDNIQLLMELIQAQPGLAVKDLGTMVKSDKLLHFTLQVTPSRDASGSFLVDAMSDGTVEVDGELVELNLSEENLQEFARDVIELGIKTFASPFDQQVKQDKELGVSPPIYTKEGFLNLQRILF
jgi:hypothetical protein